VVETDHTRLVLGPGVPQALADDARKLEGLIARRFSGPLPDGVDKRGVTIAVFTGESEYAEWVKALEQTLEENGVRFGEASWPQTVRQRFAAGTASSAAQVLDASFEAMEFPQYAECWSFTTVLCMKPEQFSRLVLELRGGGGVRWNLAFDAPLPLPT